MSLPLLVCLLCGRGHIEPSKLPPKRHEWKRFHAGQHESPRAIVVPVASLDVPLAVDDPSRAHDAAKLHLLEWWKLDTARVHEKLCVILVHPGPVFLPGVYEKISPKWRVPTPVLDVLVAVDYQPRPRL